jgi:cytoskeletal protein RodZ
MTRHKLIAMPLIVFAVFAGLVACGHRSRFVTVACASEVTEYAQRSSGSGGAKSSSSSSHSTPAKSSPAKAPSAQNRASAKNANASPPSPQHAEALKNQATARAPEAQNKSKVTPPGEKSYKPPRADVRPPAKDYDRAAVAAPQRVTRSGSYRSPVTHHVYVWHDPLYYTSPGYIPDLFDPYNQWNYTNPLSPMFGLPYNLVDAC